MVSMERVRDFLSQKRLAFVGVSRQPKDYSRALFREFCARGYDAIPVNPAVAEIEGRRSFARVQDIDPVPDGVLVLTSSAVTEATAVYIWVSSRFQSLGEFTVTSWSKSSVLPAGTDCAWVCPVATDLPSGPRISTATFTSRAAAD